VNAPLAGLLLLDKPIGLSSNAALQRVRHLAGGIKAGHGGSLDPLASGMLPICLGEATRLAGELLAGRKAYRFGVQLGERSDTGDAEGAIIERCAVPPLREQDVRAVLERMLGAHSQVPPMYSALKRNGVPLYRLARAGQSVERAPRAISIDEFALLALDGERVELRVLCSKGTYVRVLAEELARALGTCGRLYSLRREYVEPFAGEAMVRLEQLEGGADAVAQWPVLRADRAVLHLPRLQLAGPAALALAQGRAVALPAGAPARTPASWRLYDEAGGFLGLGRSDASGTLWVRRLFSHPLAV
jgi:tRNA pseudouridine55 synthase